MSESVAMKHGRAESAPTERHRERLWALAYRMLGSPEDADDAVQETCLRWHRRGPTGVRSPEAWLVTAATRVCIDRLRARQTERCHYVGPWLPTPTPRASDPPTDRAAELASDLSMAFLLLLERLAPEERAAFLLREVFDAPYAEVAAAVEKSEDAARQMVHRARQRVRHGRARFRATPHEHERLARHFAAAVEAGDPAAILDLLDPEARLVTDGGGKAWAALREVSTAPRVARGLAGAARKLLAAGPVDVGVATVNREPAILTYQEGRLVSVTALDIEAGRIRGVLRVLNPDKLREFTTSPPPPQAEFTTHGPAS